MTDHRTAALADKVALAEARADRAEQRATEAEARAASGEQHAGMTDYRTASREEYETARARVNLGLPADAGPRPTDPTDPDYYRTAPRAEYEAALGRVRRGEPLTTERPSD